MEEDYAESGQKTMSIGGTRGIYRITVVGPGKKGASRGLVPRASISKEKICVATPPYRFRESDDGSLLGERDHGTFAVVVVGRGNRRKRRIGEERRVDRGASQLEE